MVDSVLSRPKKVAASAAGDVVSVATGVVEGGAAVVSGAVSALTSEPVDPLEEAILYRRFALQFPFNVRLGFVLWSAGLVLLASPGLKTKLVRTALCGAGLALFLTPELLKRNP